MTHLCECVCVCVRQVLCLLCFLCNELSWYPFVPYPARTFLSVCACLALICSVLLLLVSGCHVDQSYSNFAWWRIMVRICYRMPNPWSH